MKKLLLLTMLAIGSVAFAENNERANKNNIIKPEAAITVSAPISLHAAPGPGDGVQAKKDSTATKTAQAPLASRLSSGDGSRFDLSVIIVDFINRSNLKIARTLLED